jgi:hypothetical protein
VRKGRFVHTSHPDKIVKVAAYVVNCRTVPESIEGIKGSNSSIPPLGYTWPKRTRYPLLHMNSHADCIPMLTQKVSKYSERVTNNATITMVKRGSLGPQKIPKIVIKCVRPMHVFKHFIRHISRYERRLRGTRHDKQKKTKKRKVGQEDRTLVVHILPCKQDSSRCGKDASCTHRTRTNPAKSQPMY